MIVGLQTQTKYNDKGEIESINISGFPAKYVNFRSNSTLPLVQQKEEPAGGLSLPFAKKRSKE